jgi:DNA replicative helicase MCM subunit Mcm2 (Cdc46/Mcm family)
LRQNISVAKAGIVCNLNARTSVIAAANPAVSPLVVFSLSLSADCVLTFKGGHYDRSKTVAENLKLSPALLSRFDLVFILLDKPDEGIDKRLSEHVMAMHGNIAARAQGKNVDEAVAGPGMVRCNLCPPFVVHRAWQVVWQSSPFIRGGIASLSPVCGHCNMVCCG